MARSAGFDFRTKFLNRFLDLRTFSGSKTMEWFGHKIVTHSKTREAAFHGFDQGRRMPANMVQRRPDARNLLLEGAQLPVVPRASRLIKLYVELRKQVRPGTDSPLCASRN